MFRVSGVLNCLKRRNLKPLLTSTSLSRQEVFQVLGVGYEFALTSSLQVGSHVRRKHKHKHKKKYVWTGRTRATEHKRAWACVVPVHTYFILCLCLCLRRTCEPALRARKGSFGAFFKRSRVVVVVSFSLAGAVIVVCIRNFMQEILQTKIEWYQTNIIIQNLTERSDGYCMTILIR